MMLTKALAEMIGTFAIIFVGGSSILLAEKYPHIFPSAAVAVTFGAMVLVMIMAVGHLSGAHFNPAVTLAFAIARDFPPRQILVYWSSQLAGGLAASVLLVVLRRL